MIPDRAIQVPFVAEKAAAVRRQAREEKRARPKLRAALSALLRTLGAACASAALSGGAWHGFQWATRSPAFAVREIRLRGNQRASSDELLRRSGLSVGQNLFRADIAAAARGLLAHPWIRSARAFRRPPSAIEIEVTERKPVALVRLGALYLLDDAGAVFKKAAPGDGLDLPLVTGLSREEWLARRPEAQLRLLTALQLLDAWTAQGLPLSQLEEVRLDEDLGVTVFARDGAAGQGAPPRLQEVRIGQGDFASRLRKLSRVRTALAQRGEHATRIDLDNEARPEWVAAQLDKDSAAIRP